MKASKALDIHIVAKHVRQRSLKNSARNSKSALLISPVEREILLEESSSAFTPSPQGSHQHQPTNAEEDSDGEDPGEVVSDASTLSLWADYLAEVFQDEEIDTNYAAIDSRLQSTDPVGNEREEDNKFEDTSAAVIHVFPSENNPGFPQQDKLEGFRTQEATLRELFGPHQWIRRDDTGNEATLAEFSISGGYTWYDISVIPP
ncbi:hypothetical protein PI125_g17306 [Phytophthora idaei]|nr:hypothetical protein PI125_g17306 [Phytophthora idaei]KAG3156306.1 hypothetical protein PI126_g8813 [Phytophthora idaei]